jgi:hypothetical protein
MGQVCVARAFRGTGVFDGIYQQLRTACSPRFDFVVTETSQRFARSLRAHRRVGFETLHVYPDRPPARSGKSWSGTGASHSRRASG